VDSNWYNSSSVRFLASFGSLPEGWSGSRQGDCITGDGSNGWLKARHVLAELGGQPAVQFRFAFGAGTQCNNYDGVGIDEISIGSAPLISGAIAFNCTSGNTANFSFETAQCPVRYQWNFDDPAAGADSVSTVPNPQHQFSAPGSYNVSVTVSSPGIAAFSTVQVVHIISVAAQQFQPIACSGGATGSVIASVSGASVPFVYQWDTSPPQNTAIATGLFAGNYTVVVSGDAVCSQAASVSLAFDSLQVAATLQQPGCRYTAGAIYLTVSGGAAPYTYNWLPAVSDNDSAVNLLTGNYQVTVTDRLLCSRQLNFTVAQVPALQAAVQKLSDANCNGTQLGTAVAILQSGTAPFRYQWQTLPIQSGDTACCLPPGIVRILVTDSNGCRTTAETSIGLSGICNDVFFSNSFSPNADRLNDGFGPLGNVLGISGYQLQVYNRYGQLVFASNNPLQKWDGTLQGKPASTGTYVWRCTYRYNSLPPRHQKGTIVLFR
jgi:gliding motility-associated-like protein